MLREGFTGARHWEWDSLEKHWSWVWRMQGVGKVAAGRPESTRPTCEQSGLGADEDGPVPSCGWEFLSPGGWGSPRSYVRFTGSSGQL